MLISLIDSITIVSWYTELRKKESKPINTLPLSVQWNLKKNVDKLNPFVTNFFNFRDEIQQTIQEKYINDEKSELSTNEDGEQVRKVKPEYLEEYQNEIQDMTQKLNAILAETNEVQFIKIDIDALVGELGDKSEFTIDDLDVFNVFNEQ